MPQAILSSHHPELIDYLGHSSGLWLKRQEGGVTTVKPLEPTVDSALRLSEVVARGWLR